MSKITDGLLAAANIVAPTIASFIPGGPLALGAFRALSNIVLGHPEGSPDDITAAVATMTPDQIAACRAKDQEYAIKMRELDITADQMEFTDRASARDLGKALAGTGDHVQSFIGAGVVIAFFGIVTLVLLGYAKVESALAGSLVGYVSAKAEQVLSYLFGNSRSSDHKTNLLAQAEPIKGVAK